MKKTALFTFVLISTLVGTVLVGDQYGMQARAQEEEAAADTNAISSVGTNLPPVNTLLGSSLPEEIDPASPFGQLVRLVQSGVEKNVILAYIKNSPRFYELDADDIIYLTDLGTPPEIIEAVIAHDQQLYEEGVHGGEPRTNETAGVVDEEPPEVTLTDFDETLSPYGTWIYVEGYGRCWRPTVVVYDSSWRPYCDNGRWVYTDRGWYWLSNYSWGWATFHYGRWFRHAHYGWCWWPDTVWAPSWVTWRYDNDYCGWAPLPPYTVYTSGVGIVYRGSSVGIGFHFDLSYNCYTFVSIRKFCDPYPRRYCVDRDRVKHIYDHTRGDCRYDMDRHRHTIINRGLPVNHVSSLTQQQISPVSIRYRTGRSARNAGYESLDRNNRTVVVNRHQLASNTRPSTQRNNTSRQSTVRTNTRRQESTEASVRSGNSGRPTGPTVNRSSTPDRSSTRGSVNTPRQNPPRSTSTPNVKPRPPASQPNRSSTVPSPSPRSNNNGNNRDSQRSTQVRQQNPSVTAPTPSPRPGNSGTDRGSQGSTQVRQQRPTPSTPPSANRQMQQNSPGRPTTPPRVQSNNSRPTPAPQAGRSRTPSVPRSAAPPPQSRRPVKTETD